MATGTALPMQGLDALLAGAMDLPDPGDAGVIAPNRHGQICQLVSGGSETRTVAAATDLPIGMELTIIMKTDDGDVAITFAADVDDAGNDVATFDDKGDYVKLFVGYVNDSTTKCWRAYASDGVAFA